jgi:drug/metabolite transporter (DMT)-like permease
MANFISTQNIGLLFALTSCLLFGLGDFFAGQLGRKFSPEFSATSLYLVEIPIITAMLVVNPDFPPLPTILALMFFGSLSVIGYFTFIYGFAYGKISIVASLAGLLALILPAVVSVISGDATSSLVWAGLVIAGLSIVLISKESEPEHEHERESHKRSMKVSLIAGTLSGIGFGFAFVGLGHVEASVLPKLFFLTLPGVIVSLIYVAIKRPSAQLFVNNLKFLFPVAVIYVLAQIFFPLATDRTSLVVTNIIVNLYPGVTIVMARIVSHERTNTIQNIGFGVAVVGLVCVTLGTT